VVGSANRREAEERVREVIASSILLYNNTASMAPPPDVYGLLDGDWECERVISAGSISVACSHLPLTVAPRMLMELVALG
jgi:hypothetical protein